MTDIALKYVSEFGGFDIYMDGNDLATDDGLGTAVDLSLFLDRRARDDDDLPKGASRRGWWGDRSEPFARPDHASGSNPDRIGSRLWLLMRERQLPAVLPRAKAIISEALAWMIEDGWVSSMDITVSFPKLGWFAFRVDLHKPDGTTERVSRTITWGV